MNCNSYFLRGLLAFQTLFLLLTGFVVFGDVVPVLPVVGSNSNSAFVASGKTNLIIYRAPWQEHFVLGPRDVLRVKLYRDSSSVREVIVDISGRISYLQVIDLPVAGLTIDEFKVVLVQRLSTYYASPCVVVEPVAFYSKHFSMLGKVCNRGIIPLSRPTTLIEAVSSAGGFELGMCQDNLIELVDFKRSIFVRNSKLVPVDFERLFNDCDLSQNIYMEPGDYVFFPSSMANTIYVLGSVRQQGMQNITSGATILRVLASAGGFTPSAYQSRVLVIRGSLSRPVCKIVDVHAMVMGRGQDFVVEPSDIVYVADHPWERAVDLLDMAAAAFLQGMASGWTGANMPALITHPLLPSIK